MNSQSANILAYETVNDTGADDLLARVRWAAIIAAVGVVIQVAHRWGLLHFPLQGFGRRIHQPGYWIYASVALAQLVIITALLRDQRLLSRLACWAAGASIVLLFVMWFWFVLFGPTEAYRDSRYRKLFQVVQQFNFVSTMGMMPLGLLATSAFVSPSRPWLRSVLSPWRFALLLALCGTSLLAFIRTILMVDTFADTDLKNLLPDYLFWSLRHSVAIVQVIAAFWLGWLTRRSSGNPNSILRARQLIAVAMLAEIFQWTVPMIDFGIHPRPPIVIGWGREIAVFLSQVFLLTPMLPALMWPRAARH